MNPKQKIAALLAAKAKAKGLTPVKKPKLPKLEVQPKEVKMPDMSMEIAKVPSIKKFQLLKSKLGKF